MNCTECGGKLFSLYSKQAGICHDCIETDLNDRLDAPVELEDRLEEALS